MSICHDRSLKSIQLTLLEPTYYLSVYPFAPRDILHMKSKTNRNPSIIAFFMVGAALLAFPFKTATGRKVHLSMTFGTIHSWRRRNTPSHSMENWDAVRNPDNIHNSIPGPFSVHQVRNKWKTPCSQFQLALIHQITKKNSRELAASNTKEGSFHKFILTLRFRKGRTVTVVH